MAGDGNIDERTGAASGLNTSAEQRDADGGGRGAGEGEGEEWYGGKEGGGRGSFVK